MNTYIGRCVGGPLDGQSLAHRAKTKTFYLPGAGDSLDDCAVIDIGEYRLNDYGQWHWWETKEGAALNVLKEARKR